jgi:hypothetical protein
MLGGKALESFDREGLIRLSPAPKRLTGMMAHTAEHTWQRRLFPDNLDGRCILTVGDETDITGDIDSCRASFFTGGFQQFHRSIILEV